MAVTLAGNLFVSVAGIVLIQPLVHLAVVDGVLDLGVLHQMLHGLVRVAWSESPAQSIVRMALVVGVTFLGEDLESRPEIFDRPVVVSFLEADVAHLVAADGPGLQVPGLFQFREGFKKGFLRIVVPAEGCLRRCHLRQPDRNLALQSHGLVDVAGAAGIFKALLILSHAVVDFRSHSAADSQFQRILLPFADADGLENVLFSLRRLLGREADSRQGVQRAGHPDVIFEFARQRKCRPGIFQRLVVVGLAEICYGKDVVAVALELFGHGLLAGGQSLEGVIDGLVVVLSVVVPLPRPVPGQGLDAVCLAAGKQPDRLFCKAFLSQMLKKGFRRLSCPASFLAVERRNERVHHILGICGQGEKKEYVGQYNSGRLHFQSYAGAEVWARA